MIATNGWMAGTRVLTFPMSDDPRYTPGAGGDSVIPALARCAANRSDSGSLSRKCS